MIFTLPRFPYDIPYAVIDAHNDNGVISVNHVFQTIQVTITTTFYVQIFRTNVVLAAFSSYLLYNVDEIVTMWQYRQHFMLSIVSWSFSLIIVWLCNFLPKNNGAKVKSWWNWLPVTISKQHFTKAFSYKSVLRSYILITLWLCIFLQKNIGAKAAREMLVKLNIAWL